MTTELDESSARAILAHAQNLSGGLTAVQPLAVKARPIADAAQIQFPSESGHFYDPVTGKQVTLPPRTWTKTYLAKGYVPGVTTITRQLHKEQLRVYDVNRAIINTRFLMNDPEKARYVYWDDDVLKQDVHALMKAESEEITGRGKELHAAIELAAQGRSYDKKWMGHIAALKDVLPIHLFEGNTEHSFATSRYGGKIDWHNDEWLLDFKTKPEIIEGKKLAYPEHCWQLAAYKEGLFVKYFLTPGQSKEVIERCTMAKKRRCANVFIGVGDAKVVFHEWTEKDLLKGWRKFEALLNCWWSDYQ